MPRYTVKDFHPEILRLFDQYVHRLKLPGAASCRAHRLLRSASARREILDMLDPRFADAQQVKPDDPRIAGEEHRNKVAQGIRRPALLSGASGRREGHGSRKTADCARSPRKPQVSTRISRILRAASRLTGFLRSRPTR